MGLNEPRHSFPPGSRGKKLCEPCTGHGNLNGPNIAKSGGVDQEIFGDLPHLHFWGWLFCEKTSLWPGSKGVLRGKSIGGKGIRIGDPPRASAERGGPMGAPQGAPTTELLCRWEKNGLPARPRK